MKINIETYDYNKYDEISKEYGEVLYRFGLTKTESFYAEIDVDCLEDILNLHRDIKEFTSGKSIPYFGIMIESYDTYDNGKPYILIKDNYD